MPPRRKPATPDTAITYVRVSTEDQAESGLGLEAQRAKVLGECERRSWRVVAQYADEGKSGKSIAGRPDLLEALEALERGDAANLVVMKLDRLSRSVHDFTGLVDRSKRQGWALVVLDIGVDTSTATGEMMSNILASFAQFERKLIGERTSAALQVKIRDGKILGRRQRQPLEVVQRICQERVIGSSLREIASALNREGVSTSQGGEKWYPSTVAAVLRRPEAKAAVAAAREASLMNPYEFAADAAKRPLVRAAVFETVTPDEALGIVRSRLGKPWADALAVMFADGLSSDPEVEVGTAMRTVRGLPEDFGR